MIPWANATNLLEKTVGMGLIKTWRPGRLTNLPLATELPNHYSQQKQAKTP
jgi:hypothetical protein